MDHKRGTDRNLIKWHSGMMILVVVATILMKFQQNNGLKIQHQ